MMTVFNRSDRIAGSFSFILTVSWGFLGGSSGEEPTCQRRGHKRYGFDPWVGKIPWRRAWQPTPALLPGEFHGRRSLADYRLWGHKGSDTTKQLITALLSSVQFSSVAQSCPTLCNPRNRSMPGLPVHHQRPEFTQTHIH